MWVCWRLAVGSGPDVMTELGKGIFGIGVVERAVTVASIEKGRSQEALMRDLRCILKVPPS